MSRRTKPNSVRIALTILAGALGSTLWAAGGTAAATPPADYSTSDWTISLGSMYQSVGGNERRFDQYVVQPSGVYPEYLGWRTWSPVPTTSYLDLSLRDLGEPGPSGDMYLVWGNDLVFDGRFRRSAFYPDFSSDTPQGAKRDYSLGLGSSAGPERRFMWRSTYDNWALDAADAWRQGSWNNTAGFRAGNYDVSFDWRHDDFQFLTQPIFSGAANRYGFSFASTGYSATSLTGSFAVNTVDLDGLGRSFRSTEGSVTMTRALRDDLSVWARLRRHAITQTINENAYAQANTSAHFEARYTPRPRTSLVGFWETGQVDYVDGAQTSTVDVPTNTFGLDLRTRPAAAVSLRARYQHTTNTNRPFYHTLAGPLANTLIFGTKTRLDFSASWTPRGRPFGLNGEWFRDAWTNDAQSINNQVKTKAVTAWWQRPSSRLSLTGSWMRQNFDLPLVDVITALPYTSEDQVWTLGAAYQLTPRTMFNATYLQAKSLGAITADYARTILGVSHHAGRHDNFSAEVTLGNFEDTTDNSLAYDADLYRFSWQREF